MKLFVIDDLSPEDTAMLQALYSRSASSVETHLEKVRRSGSGKFMASYYVGYGHKSIADCGSTTMFIEDVSLLAAKAIQDWPLYSGQETSTRYIDMAKRHIVDPVGTKDSTGVLECWMNFYVLSQKRVAEIVRTRYPKKPDEQEDIYERAVKARTFDILRGFLPAGITTQLSWHSNIRQAGDHLVGLVKHPAPEVAALGRSLRELLGARYPSSGLEHDLATVSGVTNERTSDSLEREEWHREVSENFTYFTSPALVDEVRMHSSAGFRFSFDAPFTGFGISPEAMKLVKTRPRGCVLPHVLSRLGSVYFRFPIDFGSFRDIQRHRNGVCRMPLLTTEHGFEPWYLRELGPLEEEARALIEHQKKRIWTLSDDPVLRQYYIALGFRVPCEVSYGLPAAVYVLELRSGKTVHPTLRMRIHEMIAQFRERFSEIPLHVDMDPDDWTVRRGEQTIVARS